MTTPCPAPDGYAWTRMQLHYPDPVWALHDASWRDGLLGIQRADGWTICGRDGTILRDGVSDGRLPGVVAALLNPNPDPDLKD